MTLYTYVTVRYGFYSCGKRQKITREEEEKRIVIETEKCNREIKEDNERRKEDNEKKKEDDKSRKEDKKGVVKNQESIASLAEKKRLNSIQKKKANKKRFKNFKRYQRQESKRITATKATAKVAKKMVDMYKKSENQVINVILVVTEINIRLKPKTLSKKDSWCLLIVNIPLYNARPLYSPLGLKIYNNI